MKGRFEQPRNGQTPETDPRQAGGGYPEQSYGSDPNANNSYYQNGYQPDPYQQGGYNQESYNQDFYGQDPNNQNSYSQDPYGQNSYDQDPYSQSPYGQGSYNQDPYSQDTYGQNPYNQNPYGQNPYGQNPYNGNYNGGNGEKGGFGWGVLCFFLPIVGLILWLVWRQKKPRAAKCAGIGGIIGLIMNIVLILALVIGGTTYYNHMLGKVNIVQMEKTTYPPATDSIFTEATEEETEAETEAETTEPPTTEPPKAKREDYVNILIVGQAARSGEAERFADTMMLCTLNKFDNSLTVTSLLRDSFVQPPPFHNIYFGQIKLTTVYHMGSYYDHGNPAGSMELMNNTLYDNFGIEVDYNVEISFETFEEVVNLLGGVDIELTEPEANYLNKVLNVYEWADYHFEPGMNHLDGFSGLGYARMRKAEGDGESDIKRTARQRKFMEVVMQKLKTMKISDIQNIANAVLPEITTNMSKQEITDMLMTLLPKLPTMEFKSGGTCPHEYSGVMIDIYHDGMYHSVLKFVPQEVKKHMREITLGEVAE